MFFFFRGKWCSDIHLHRKFGKSFKFIIVYPFRRVKKLKKRQQNGNRWLKLRNWKLNTISTKCCISPFCFMKPSDQEDYPKQTEFHGVHTQVRTHSYKSKWICSWIHFLCLFLKGKWGRRSGYLLNSFRTVWSTTFSNPNCFSFNLMWRFRKWPICC